jgi:LmbE family N-acetylglucosaminyl deacetylase
MKNLRSLILAPHIDDEVLGCYSFLNADTHVMYFGVEEREYVSSKERIEEMKQAAKLKKFDWHIEKFRVNNYQVSELIDPIEKCINSIHPGCVIIPHPSYNQDHRAVYEAASVALRPHDKNHFVNMVLVYEQPHTMIWPVESFEPNYFIEINIDDKLELYGLYKSQVREYRSFSIVRSIAQIRGSQANKKYAEAYYCIRFIK